MIASPASGTRQTLSSIPYSQLDDYKLNADKTEFLIIGKQKQRGKHCFFPTPMLSQNFTPTVSARNLGVTFTFGIV